MDMAPYYLNMFVNLVGAVDSVATMSKITWPERTIHVAPRKGEKIKVEVPTYVSTLLKFKNGVIATFVNAFDIWCTKQPNIEIFGEKGTIVLPDPNRYTGDVLMRRFKEENWQVLPQFSEYSKYGRAIGVVDMIRSIENNIPHRASAEMAYHITDVIFTMDEAQKTQKELKVDSDTEKPSGLWNTTEPFYI